MMVSVARDRRRGRGEGEKREWKGWGSCDEGDFLLARSSETLTQIHGPSPKPFVADAPTQQACAPEPRPTHRLQGREDGS